MNLARNLQQMGIEVFLKNDGRAVSGKCAEIHSANAKTMHGLRKHYAFNTSVPDSPASWKYQQADDSS